MAYNMAGTGRFDLVDNKNPQDPDNEMNVLVKTEDGEPISIPKMVWAKGQGQNSESFGTDPESERNAMRLEDYLYRGSQAGPVVQDPISDDIRNRFLTEDERRSEFMQATHPTSLMMSNPMSSFMMNDQGQMGGPETWFKNMGAMFDTGGMSNAAPSTEYMNQFMGIPFASGLPGSTPDDRMPVAPALNPGQMTPDPTNNPDKYQDYAGHSKQEMPAFNAQSPAPQGVGPSLMNTGGQTNADAMRSAVKPNMPQGVQSIMDTQDALKAKKTDAKTGAMNSIMGAFM